MSSEHIGHSMFSYQKMFFGRMTIILFFLCCQTLTADDDPFSHLFTGQKTRVEDLPSIEISHGVTARLFWGDSCLVSLVTVEPGAMIPLEILPAERIIMVTKGKVSQLIDDRFVPMTGYDYEPMTPVSGRRGRMDFVYLEQGSPSALKAGNQGAELIEVYSPIRRDYLTKAGLNVNTDDPQKAINRQPTVEAGKVYNYYNLQFTDILPGGYTRLISGRHVQLSFLRMDPGSSFPGTRYPEEQIMLGMRGTGKLAPGNTASTFSRDDVTFIPSNMAHSAVTGSTGCDILCVFHPVRDVFREKERMTLAAFHDIIPRDAEIELVVDGSSEGPGLCFIEGPTWLNEKLYFSSMHYDALWEGDPQKSALVEMEGDGSYRYIHYGEMETNGTFALDNGNLAVCDMYGHRVVEMSTDGLVVQVLVDSCDGKRLDGPNDLVVDLKGGIYFTDPQILPEPHMQPGRSVMYRRPNGKTIRVVEPGVLIKPNGLILSPDCRRLYINSTHENFMMAYDVNENGTLSGGKRFGNLKVTPEILDGESIDTQADGMTVDERGNIYITTILGLQIFGPDGDYIGYIHYPEMPVNCCFGGPDGRTLYTTCNDKVYRIRTNVRGAAYTLK